MDWNQTCDRLRNRMFALARCPWEGKVECVQGPCSLPRWKATS